MSDEQKISEKTVNKLFFSKILEFSVFEISARELLWGRSGGFEKIGEKINFFLKSFHRNYEIFIGLNIRTIFPKKYEHYKIFFQ